jgi:hypothetical protein
MKRVKSGSKLKRKILSEKCIFGGLAFDERRARSLPIDMYCFMEYPKREIRDRMIANIQIEGKNLRLVVLHIVL